jgi:hypothetical protein
MHGIPIARITAIMMMMTIVIANDFAACSLLSLSLVDMPIVMLVLVLMLPFPGRRRRLSMGLHRWTVSVIVAVARSGLCNRRILWQLVDHTKANG